MGGLPVCPKLVNPVSIHTPMPAITLPDGSQKQFDEPVSVHEVAASIGSGLAKAALAGRVDGTEVDTSYVIDTDCALEIITARDDAGAEVDVWRCAGYRDGTAVRSELRGGDGDGGATSGPAASEQHARAPLHGPGAPAGATLWSTLRAQRREAAADLAGSAHAIAELLSPVPAR